MMKNLLLLMFVVAPVVGVAQIRVSDKVFKNLDSALNHIDSAQTLRLDSEDMVEISPSIIKLVNLRSLSLTNNERINFVDLFDKLSLLPKLEFLNLSDCKIENLPTNIAKLSHLKRLMLGNNKLPTLPSEIGKLPKLSEVIFSQYPSDFRRLTDEQKLQMLALLPHSKIFLVDYFGGEHGNYRLGAEKVRVTKTKLWPNN